MNQIRRHKKTLAFLGAVALVFGILGFNLQAIPAGATEVSGRIIKQLVADVDKEMTKLETKVAVFSGKSKSLTDDLRKEFEKLQSTKDDTKKDRATTEMLIICAALNEQDLKEIKAYKETLNVLIPKMERLKAEIRIMGNMGFKEKEMFTRFQYRVGKMMTNSVRIMKKLRTLSDDEKMNHELISIENTLVGTYRMFQSPLSPGPVSYAHLEQSIRIMEHTYADLNSVENLLANERLRLKVDNVNQLGILVLKRLFKGRLNIGKVHEMPGKIRDNVLYRTKLYSKAANVTFNSHMGANGSRTHTPSTRALLDKIGSGNPFKQ